MAHRCYTCGNKCHCGGDIDDLILHEADYCSCCREDKDFEDEDDCPECGSEFPYHEDDCKLKLRF